MRLENIASIDDLKHQAKKRLPTMFFDYIEQGAFEQLTLKRNQEDFKHFYLKQSAFINTENKDMKTQIFGESYAMPIGFGPTGLMGMFWPNAEMDALSVCQNYNIPFCQSMMSICSLEDLAKVATKPFWFQLYIIKNKTLLKQLIERAKQVGVSTLFINADLPTTGIRYCDIRNGMMVPPRLTINTYIDILKHPSWLWKYLFCKRKTFGNIAALLPNTKKIDTITRYMNSQYDPSTTWDDIKRIRESWPGKFVIKGILTIEDAKMAKSMGADGIVISNHGGRQLDGVPSSINALANMMEDISKENFTLFYDGGLYNGPNIIRALSLGADVALLGRALLYGMAAYGPDGLAKAIELLRNEVDTAMTLTGVHSLHEIDRSIFIPTD